MVLAGGIQAAVAAMRAHAAHQRVQAQGVRLLVALSAESRRAEDEGGIEAVVAAMKRETENADLQEVVRG